MGTPIFACLVADVCLHSLAGSFKVWGGSAKIISQCDRKALQSVWRRGLWFVPRVEELSQKKGVSMAQIAIAWSLSKKGELPERLIARIAK